MKTQSPLVSIIINCFNGEKYLREALQSVLNQGYKNWEVIFWDNQSSDTSASIFKSYKDKRFKYYYSKKHTSLYQARNCAIEKTKGELLAFIDTDDLWDQNKLEIQVPFFENPEVTLVYSNLWITKENIKNKKIFIKKNSPSGYLYEKLLNDYNVGIITTVLRKSITKELPKLFDERFSIIGDFDFFLKLSKSYYFHYIDKPLAYYRIHGNNFSSVYKKKEMEEFDIWLNENKSTISKKNLVKIEKKINLRKFLHFKFEKNYKSCLKILVKSSNKSSVIKMFIIFFIPLYILRKISWFHS